VRVSIGRFDILDPLYGRIVLPSIALDALLTPEMQRLREVRLANNISLVIPGGNNISRYEHSIGVVYLAQIAAENIGIKQDSIEYQAFIIAALTHDVISSPFGHTIEYTLSKKGFKHANISEALFTNEYSHFSEEPLYMGYPPALKKVLPDKVLTLSYEFIQGVGFLGRLISGDIDLDNIDNVFRLSYHMGIPYERGKAEAIVRALRIQNGNLVVDRKDFELLQYWLETRQHLYDKLSLSSSSFLGEAMLSHAAELAVNGGEIEISDWKCVDFQLIEKLLNSKMQEVRTTIKHLMIGDLFSLIGILEVENANPDCITLLLESKEEYEQMLKNLGVDGFLYVIVDLDKSSRELKLVQADSGASVVLGHNASRILVGVIRKTQTWSATTKNQFNKADVNKFGHDIDTWIMDYLCTRLSKLLGRMISHIELDWGILSDTYQDKGISRLF